MSSYLESVLNSRKKLPSQVRESLETISNLDRVGTHLSEAIDHSVVTLEKAEGITDTQKSQLELMCEAMETITSNKEKIARCNYDILDNNISMLDEEIKMIERVLNKHAHDPRVMRALEEKHQDGNSNGNVRNIFDEGEGSEFDEFAGGIPGVGSANVGLIIDPNEPVYCICRQVQYGEMIACDNEDCDIEWFHMGCVNLHKKPKQRWLCPECNRRK